MTFILDPAHCIILRAHIYMPDFHQWVYKMKTAAKNLILDFTEKDFYTNLACIYLDNRRYENTYCNDQHTDHPADDAVFCQYYIVFSYGACKTEDDDAENY